MATHSSVLAWRIPGMGLHRVGHNWSDLSVACLWPTHASSVLSDSLWACSPPGSSVSAIFQVRILEWVAISYSRVSSWPRDWTYVSCVSWHCRQILYSLSHQRSPCGLLCFINFAKFLTIHDLFRHSFHLLFFSLFGIPIVWYNTTDLECSVLFIFFVFPFG